MAKTEKKFEALKLRSQGLSIRKIAETLSVSKSSASYWCKNIVLSPPQIKKLKDQQRRAGIRALINATETKRRERLEKIKKLGHQGKKDVGVISKRDIFICGLALYWGEGYKKGNDEVGFTNSDPEIIKFFIMWLEKIYGIKIKDLILRVSINQIHKYREKAILKYWTNVTQVSLAQFTKTSFIKTKTKKNYPNFHEHFGTLRVKVRRGTDLRRKIMGSLSALTVKNSK